jgi:hypothetical protein
MKNAISKGVVIVKAAGNSGRDGPFNADVATAAGTPSICSQPACHASFGPHDLPWKQHALQVSGRYTGAVFSSARATAASAM